MVNPYYQMNGGWMQKKPFEFDSKNNIVLDNMYVTINEITNVNRICDNCDAAV